MVTVKLFVKIILPDLTQGVHYYITIALLAVIADRHPLFKSTGSGESLVKEINPHLFYGVDSDDVVLDDTLYFMAENSIQGVGLWRSDGTSAGTSLVHEINPTSADPDELTAVNGMLFFAASDAVRGRQLWESDGTEAGTFPVSCTAP